MSGEHRSNPVEIEEANEINKLKDQLDQYGDSLTGDEERENKMKQVDLEQRIPDRPMDGGAEKIVAPRKKEMPIEEIVMDAEWDLKQIQLQREKEASNLKIAQKAVEGIQDWKQTLERPKQKLVKVVKFPKKEEKGQEKETGWKKLTSLFGIK